MKFWTLLSGTSFVASISNPSFTHDPMLAVMYDSIKKADIAAIKFKRKYGLPVMVHVVESLPESGDIDIRLERSYTSYEDEAHSAFYGENL